MHGVLVVMALAQESAGRFERAGVPVLYTGVGKVNAAYRLACELQQRSARGQAVQVVLNLGTAGSVGWPRGAVVACTRFIQRDMDASALGFRPGVTPFDPTPAELQHGPELPFLPDARCASGDSFVTNAAADPGDVLDMEAFALARVCLGEGVRFACAKYVTDGADADAAPDWTGGVRSGAEALLEVYRRFVATSGII
jgi:adenosylhomocysteine nucleosidase